MANATTATAGPMGAAPAVPADPDRIEPRRLVAFLAMVFGMFMAILDIQIVSASLAEIQAGLAASANEITWVQTAYLISEVVMIPLSGYLSRALGTRLLFSISAGGFTAASLMCGLSTGINEMIFWRAVQGFIGGGMIPTVFATAYTIFPRSRMGLVVPMIGLVATMAPTIGPTVGGYLTDALSWHWLFFINIVPGLAVTAAALILIDFDKPDWSLLNHFDWVGLLSMAGFLGALEYVLEEGPRNDWFGDDSVLLLAWVSVISAIVFFVRVLTAREPIVDLRAFSNRNFALGSLFSFVVGIGLYGLTYLYPVYLGQIRGYNALMIGETMFVSGVVMFLTAPIAGRLMTRVDPRYMLMAGFLSFAAGTYWMTYLTKDWDFWELFWPQVFRGVGLMIVDDPGQQHRARHAAARPRQECLGPVQPDAQPGRRHRARRADHHPQRPHRPASGAPARVHHLVAPPGHGDAQQPDAAVLILRQRRAADGAQAAQRHRAPAGRGDGLRRRVPCADLPVRRPRRAVRADPAPAGQRSHRRRALRELQVDFEIGA